MVWESILLMFLLALGTFQIIATWGEFKGMCFFPHPLIGYVFGAMLIVGGFTWFFVDVQVGEGGPKGQHDDQALSIFVGGGVALMLTWFIPSITKRKSMGSVQVITDDPEGIEALKYMTFMQSIRSRLSANRKKS